MVVIRAGSVADAAQVAAVQREGWFAAYAGIIPAEVIDRVTAPDDGARVRQSFRTRPWQRMLVAVAAEPERPGKTPGPGGAPAGPGVVGYASFGPETDVLNAAWPHPTSTDGEDGRVGELYALYVRPAWWSTGTGREVRKVFHDGPDVLTWFDLATSVAGTVPVANWMHVQDGKITRIRVAFDARGFAAAS